MSPTLRRQLIKLLHNRPARPPRHASLTRWLDDHGICRNGEFNEHSYQRLEASLKAEGVNPYAEEHDGSRAASWQATGSDKSAAKSVGRQHVLIRPIPGSHFNFTTPIYLPRGGAIRITLEQLRDLNCHRSIMLVENLEAFDNLEKMSFTPDCWDNNPLVVFRGTYGLGGAGRIVGQELNLPVHVFADIDPSGLQIAATTPSAASMVMPCEGHVEKLVKQSRNAEAFRLQLAVTGDYSVDERIWVRNAYNLITRLGCMLPQEAFLLDANPTCDKE